MIFSATSNSLSPIFPRVKSNSKNISEFSHLQFPFSSIIFTKQPFGARKVNQHLESLGETLLERTRHLLINRPKPVTLELLSEQTGLSTSWLSSLISGDFSKHGPGVLSVQKLYEHLSGSKLFGQGQGCDVASNSR